MLRSLPRRGRLAHTGGDLMAPRLTRTSPPEAPLYLVLVRAAAWLFALLQLALRLGWDRLRGRRDMARTAIHVRAMFERMGGIAIKVGQQLASRVDLLPFEVCLELGELLDAVPPFDIEHARARIEAALGRPASELFAELDPVPIGSASIACVFRARLHSGERVAVKVRRPEVGRAFSADLSVLDLLTRTLELTTLVRPGFFRYLRTEMREMFLDELDFRKEATFQILFRRHTRKDRIRWLTAPRVFATLCAEDVLTTELVEGVVCTDLLQAVETKDAARLAEYSAMGIDPEVIAERLMVLSFWSRHERPFFHADPHPGNIFIRAGGELVLLDFGCCGVMSRKNVHHSVEVQRRLVDDDIGGVATVSAGLLAPLPCIDTSELIYRLENKFFRFYVGAWTKDAEWWERTTARLWLNLVEVTRDLGLPVNLEMLRLMRSSLLYDTLACRLHPRILIAPTFRVWQRGAARRAQRRARRRRRNITPKRVRRRLRALFGETTELLAKGAFGLGNLSRDPPMPRIPMIGKAAFVATTLIDFGVSMFWIASALGAAIVVERWLSGGALDLGTAAARAASHPAFVGLAVVSFILAVRRILFRLGDADAEG